MALTISEFYDIAPVPGFESAQVPKGPPLRVTSVTGAFTVGADCSLIRIAGQGTITWPTDSTPEPFDGIEFRGVRAGDTMTVA